jgi:hypothetical protein
MKVKACGSRHLTFLTSKRFLPAAPVSDPPALALPTAFLARAADPEGASVISISAMVTGLPLRWWKDEKEVDVVGGVLEGDRPLRCKARCPVDPVVKERAREQYENFGFSVSNTFSFKVQRRCCCSKSVVYGGQLEGERFT